MSKLLGVLVLLFVMTAAAQSKSDKPIAPSLDTWTIQVPRMPQNATWSDKITKDGHYVGTFNDPNNQFRCDVVSYLDNAARNVLYSDITSLTIVCTKRREPINEGEATPSTR